MKLFRTIYSSCLDHLGKPSTNRINAYIMSFLIGIIILSAVAIEIIALLESFKTGVPYTLSTQLIILAGLVFGQQALLLNLKRKSEETSFPTVERIKELEKGKEPVI